MRLASLLLASCATLALAPASALAADYDPPIFVEEAPEWVPVEIGSGWYLRGDVAYNFDRGFTDTTARLDGSIFDAGLVNFHPDVPLDVFSLSERTTPVSASVGFGYHFNDFLRAEVNIGFLANDRYSGSGFLGERFSYLNPGAEFGCAGTRSIVSTTTFTNDDGEETSDPLVETALSDAREGCGVEATMRNSAWNGTVNAYADLGTIAGFTPYVGAGAGLLYSRTRLSVEAQCQGNQDSWTTTRDPVTGAQTHTTDAFLCQGQTNPTDPNVTYNPINLRHAEYNFLYSLHAGVAYAFNDNTTIDVGYQYSSVPKYSGADFHQVKVGLRYNLW